MSLANPKTADEKAYNARKSARWRKQNPIRARELDRQGYKSFTEKLKHEFFTAYGDACECCGETERVFLTLEHKRGDGKAHRESVGGSNWAVLVDLRRRGWPKDDYGILCWNCNEAKRYGRTCPHQRES